jgi:hypothetical protein
VALQETRPDPHGPDAAGSGGVHRRDDPYRTCYFFTVTPTLPTAVPP